MSISIEPIREWCGQLGKLSLEDQISALNEARKIMHESGPFKDEPVDYIEWVHTDKIQANDYNPNSVAPPEMELLRVSILEDHYTQPIVSWKREDDREVVDGFHRNRIGRECKEIRERIHGYLPLTTINSQREDRGDRIASTIRHNRARGKHAVESMSDIVVELKRRNWSDERICRELGMDQDEVLRLVQITGLSEMFSDEEFSKSWDVEHFEEIYDPVEISSEAEIDPEDDSTRILHTWENWECYPAGFYRTKPPKGMTAEQCEETYRKMLVSIPDFEASLTRVVSEWPKSCEHYLTNDRMNRIAWLGQASLCIQHGIPSIFRGGFNLLSQDEQSAANEAALRALNAWLEKNGRTALTMDEAQSRTEADLY